MVDISDKDYRFKVKEVMKLIEDLGLSDIPILRVNNKSDKANLSNLDELSASKNDQVWISAQNEEGFDNLIKSINVNLYGEEQKKMGISFPRIRLVKG